jgi:sugar diacid utilization regulator
MDLGLVGRYAVVTGGTRSIGRAAALRESGNALPRVVPEPRRPAALTEVDLSEQGSRVARILLLGVAGPVDRRLEASLLGLDMDGAYIAFRARAVPGFEREDLMCELGLTGSRHQRGVLAADLDGDLIGLLPEEPTAVTSGVVGLGSAAPPDRLAESFQLASRAMDAATAFGLTGVHTFSDLGLLPAIVADPDLGEALWQRYVHPVAAADCGPEKVAALRTWFACGMHVDRAAAQMTVHPNTVRNRIARFEELAGVDLRDTAAAMQIWWALTFRDSRVAPTVLPRSRPRPDVRGSRRMEVASGYRAAEPHRRVGDRERAEFVRDLLWGNLDPGRLAMAAAAHGIQADREYFAVRARPSAGSTMDELALAHGIRDGRSGDGLAAVVDGDLVGFVTSPPQLVVRGVSGLGPARPLALLHESFRMASRALDAAQRQGMTGTGEFSSLGLLPAILSDEASGEVLYRRYVVPLGDSELTGEMLHTLGVYLRHGLHVNATARTIHVHPNTVRYRIARFEELAGVALRSDRRAAFEVLWALEYRANRAGPSAARGVHASRARACLPDGGSHGRSAARFTAPPSLRTASSRQVAKAAPVLTD